MHTTQNPLLINSCSWLFGVMRLGLLNFFYTHGVEDHRNSMKSDSQKKSKENIDQVVVPAEKEIQEVEAQEKNAAAQIDFPDGGLRAWLVVLGTSFSAFASFGYVNSWGVFQSYYEQTLLKQYSASTIAWIGSVQYALVLFPALFSGRLFDLGIFKLPFLAASVLVVVATFLVAQCTQYWHFLLCQGFALGIGCGMIFGPALGIIGQWFKNRKGFALGLTALGSSVGGTVFPIAARKLIFSVGFPWTMRILGFILLFSLAVPNFTLARRLPPKNVSGGLFNPAAFKSAAYTVYAAASIVAFLGLYTVLTYIDISAVSLGISEDFAFYLISIANASSAFGRVIAGVMTDRFGAINFIAPMTFFAGIMTYAWPFARSEGSLIAVAIIYGFMCGTYVSTFLVPVFELGEVSDIGRRTGMIMSLGAIGSLVGPPISGAINTATGGFEAVGYYAGSMIVLSVILMLITRHLVLRKLWGKF